MPRYIGVVQTRFCRLMLYLAGIVLTFKWYIELQYIVCTMKWCCRVFHYFYPKLKTLDTTRKVQICSDYWWGCGEVTVDAGFLKSPAVFQAFIIKTQITMSVMCESTVCYRPGLQIFARECSKHVVNVMCVCVCVYLSIGWLMPK